MATAHKIHSASTAYDPLTSYTQVPPSPAKPTGLPLPNFFCSHAPAMEGPILGLSEAGEENLAFDALML
jgi:hypothetical protein